MWVVTFRALLLGELDRELQICEQRDGVARDHYINHAVKQLLWHRLSAIVLEDLSGLKRGKSQSRGQNFASPILGLSAREATDQISGTGKPCLAHCCRSAGRLPNMPRLWWDRHHRTGERFDVSPAITRVLPISSALETS